jgi:quercetin dioxygenase-like cupin family protein
MRIHNVYEDANGESHFRDIEVDWVEETPTGKQSKRLPATGIVFRETTTDFEHSWHRAPRRQYVISLAGGITITASDGETRHIGAGEIVLVEDTTGKGHITKSSGDKPRHTIFVPID